MAEASNSFIPDDAAEGQGSFVADSPGSSFVPSAPDTAAMKSFVADNLKRTKEEKAGKREPIDTSVKPVEAMDWLDGIAAGWGMSVTGLMGRGEVSPLAPTESSGRLVNIASQIGSIAGDVPFMVAGGVIGAYAGTAAMGPVIGTAVGAEFTANALPAGLRKIMMDHYEKGDITNASDFLDRLAGTTWETLKAGGVGVATMGAGRAIAPAVGRLGANAATQTIAKTTAELSTMVTLNSAMEGQLPNSQDFINTGIVLAGLGGSLKVASKLRKNFIETGSLPSETLDIANQNVEIRQEIVAVNDRTVPPPDVKPPKDLMDTPPSKLAEKWTEFYTKTSEGYQRGVDDLASFRMAKDALAQGKGIPAGSDPYLLARNYRGTVEARAVTFETQRTLDFKTGKPNGEGLNAIYKDLPADLSKAEITDAEATIISRINPDDVAGKDPAWKKLNSYRIAKRSIELAERGIETGIDKDAALKVVQEGKVLEPIVKRLEAYSDRALQYAADSGAISGKELELIRRMNRDYVPFHRLLDDDPMSDVSGMGNPLKRIKGSDALLLDPERAMRANTKAMIRLAEKNRIYNRLVEMQETAGDGAPQILQKKMSTQRPLTVQAEEIRSFLEKNGVDTKDLPEESLTIFRPGNEALRRGEFQVKREGSGRREVWAIDSDYADAFDALNRNPGETSLLIKMLSAPARALRMGTALSPDFMLRNIWRDQFSSTVQSKYGSLPFVDALKSVGMMWRKDEAWLSFLESGGFSGGLADLKPLLNNDLYALNKETGFMDKAWNVVKHPIHALEIVSNLAENVPRFTEYRKSGAVGGTYDDMVRGAMGAREVTVDFQRAGALARKISPFVPFMNVGIQGTDRLIRLFKENPKRATALATATITLPSIMTWLNGRDDSRYQDAPSWQKHLFWVVPTDNWEPASSVQDYESRASDLKRIGKNGQLEVNNGIVFRIPKPFELGVLFGSIPEMGLNSFYKKDPGAFKEFDNTVIQALIPNAVPTVALGIAEHLSNHSFFLDTDIVSPHAERFLPEERYSPYTSETAKQIAKIIGYVPYIRDIGSRATPLQAPAVIDNYLNVWGGTGGKYLIQLSDAILQKAGVGKQEEKPAWTWGDTPFVKAFVMKYPAKTEPIREFYDRYNKAQQVQNSIKQAMKEGRADRVAELTERYEGRMARLQDVYEILGNQNKVLNNLQNSATGLDGQRRDPSQRTQLMTTIYYQMNETAKAANTLMDELEANAGGGN